MIWTACDAGLIDGERRIPACLAGEYQEDWRLWGAVVGYYPTEETNARGGIKCRRNKQSDVEKKTEGCVKV